MPTAIIRPNGTTSQQGWGASNIHTIIGDNNASTVVDQTSTLCDWKGPLSDLDASLSGATINSMTISMQGEPGRAGASTVTFVYIAGDGTTFGSEAENFTGGDQTVTTSARTTQDDGSSALTYTFINAMSLSVVPNNQGITAKEVFITVDYTVAVLPKLTYDTTVNNIHITSGNINVPSGNIFI